MTSYEKFIRLCKARQVSPTAALLSSGLSRSLGSKWKKTGGYTPSTEVEKMREHFRAENTHNLLTRVEEEQTES